MEHVAGCSKLLAERLCRLLVTLLIHFKRVVKVNPAILHPGPQQKLSWHAKGIAQQELFARLRGSHLLEAQWVAHLAGW